MKICIDGFAASNLIGTSLYSYSKEVITSINSSENMSPFILWDNFPLKFYWERLSNSKFIPLKIDRIYNDYSTIENFLKENSIEIYHSPNNGFSIPKEKICKYITTIHSLYPLIDKSEFDEKYYTKFKKIVPLSLEKSDLIIALSDIVKEELISILDIPEKKIIVKYPKCNDIFVPKEDDFCNNFLKRHYHINCPYVLFVGSITPRKMLDKTILLFKSLTKKIPELKLLILGDFQGKREHYYKKLLNLISQNNLNDNIVFLGIVKQSHLPIFYKSSLCVLDFSIYNSYPLSSVEAINSDALVLTNKSIINQKVLNKSAVYCNLDETYVIIDFIETIYNNKNFKLKIKEMFRPPLNSTEDELLCVYE